MQIARLEGFYWVARTGGYAAAARAFPYPLTQPAVFQQVRKLEDELGVRLFERVGKAEVRLTAAGRQLYDHAAPFFERLPAVERALKAATPARELRLAAEALILQQVLPRWVRRLQRREPDLRLEVRELAAPDPEVVRSGEVDLAVAYFPGALPAGLASRPVATLSSFLVLPGGRRARASAARRAARARRPDLRDLQPWHRPSRAAAPGPGPQRRGPRARRRGQHDGGHPRPRRRGRRLLARPLESTRRRCAVAAWSRVPMPPAVADFRSGPSGARRAPRTRPSTSHSMRSRRRNNRPRRSFEDAGPKGKVGKMNRLCRWTLAVLVGGSLASGARSVEAAGLAVPRASRRTPPRSGRW